MNLLKWLKDKAGKMPVTITQAAGLTAVVGAAGFAAMNYLSTPSDNNNTFMPPAFNQGEVVYVSQNGGGGQYESNGEVGSSFNAAPSRAIQLANEQAVRQAQTRALEEASQQTPSYGSEPGDTPQAYQLSGADLGLGLGGGQNKQLNTSLDTFSTIQNQLAGVTDAVNQATRSGQPGAQGSAKPADAAAGQNAAQLASAQRNWGNGLTRAGGGGSGSANSFAIQDSGKNARTRGGAGSDTMGQAGDAIAQARAAMADLSVEGSRMRAQANFGNSEGFRNDRNARTRGSRRFGQGKDELEFIRKKSAAIASNKTNAANEGGSPFLASTKISGGLTVNGENVTTGQSSSGDFKSNFDRTMKGVQARMDKELAHQTKMDLARSELKSWLWTMLTVGVLSILAITALVSIAKAGGPFTAWAWVAAGVVTAAALIYIWYNTIDKVTHYNALAGHDKWTTISWILSGVITGGIGLAWFVFSGEKLGNQIKDLFTTTADKEAGQGAAEAFKNGATQAGSYHSHALGGASNLGTGGTPPTAP